ncbi:hypothetical protein R1flu_025743 [Riccia fluitans]|uniref:Uncharacterized protein n=1 Tax=Riccia fluitans TaxID=41844 RepID=A0ABD1Y1S0_9MARC
MAGRMSIRILNQRFWQVRYKVPPLQSHMRSSVFEFRTLDSPAGGVIQGSSGETSIQFISRVQGYAGMHGARSLDSASQPTYGVGPVMGGDRDPRFKGDTPDDFRAAEMNEVEPKEVTKEAAAQAMQEPPDYQISKAVPEESKPIEHDADPQRADEEKPFNDEIHELKGSAQYQGETTGTEKSGHEVESQYGVGPDEGRTTRP